jgi:threonine dehydrogenase-like Zn-dependent dehydrogenase
MTMQAAVLAAPGKIEISRVPSPSPNEQEVLVRVEGCGVCGSNLPAWEGRSWFHYPFAPGELGHEAYGRIDRVGSQVRGFFAGQRVAFLSSRAYAEFDCARSDALVLLPPSLDDVPVPAEPLACAMNIFERSQVRAGDVVAIVGIGFLGALLTQLAVGAGARVLAITRRRFALQFARDFGAIETIAWSDPEQIVAEVGELTNAKLCDVVIECVGKQTALDLASALTAERGRLVIAGYHQGGLRTVNMQPWNWRGIDVINAHERDPAMYVRGMRAAVAALVRQQLDLLPLCTHFLPLEELGRALDLMRDRPDGFMKAIVTP